MRTFRFLLVSVLAATGLSVAIAPSANAAATVAGFSQCANGTGTALTCADGWVNGSLGAANSHYAEDQVVPQRALISLPADNLEHSLTFTYQDRKGSTHAYDSLATWNKTVSNADPCQGISASLCAGGFTQIDMTSDPAGNIPPASGGNSTAVNTHELDQADRKWTMYGGALTTDVAATHSSPLAGDDLVTVTVKFRNATPGVARTGVLLFGGHLAVGGPNAAPRAWGQNLGASSVSGGPYAFKLESIDGGSTGATANSIKAGGVAPLPPAVFTITKTASATTTGAGTQVTYTVTVRNTGGVAASTTFVDDYNNNLTAVSTPSGCTQGTGSMSCTTNTIQPGGNQVFSYTAVMPATFNGGATCTGGYQVANTATLANGTFATAVVCVTAAPRFTVTKTASPANPIPGGTVNYTITVTNEGNAAAATTFTDNYDNRLSPTVPAGCTDNDDVLSCTTGTIAANGGTQVFEYSAVMPASFDGGTTCTGGYLISNKVTVTGGAEDTANVCVQAAPSFTVVKDVSANVAEPGQTVTYTLTVTNSGKASGSTSVTDTPAAGITLGPLPTGCSSNLNGSFTCSTGTIAPNGGTKVFSYTGTVPSTFEGESGTGDCDEGTFEFKNTATVGSSTSSQTVCVGAVPDFTITKTADPDEATPGQTVTYTIKVKNIGAASGQMDFADDYDDALSPTVPTSATTGSCAPGTGEFECSTGTVLAGVTVTFTYTAVMPDSFGEFPGGDGCVGTYPIRNTAKLDSGPSSLSVVCVTAAPAFTVTKSVDKPDASPEDLLTYTVTVKNTGSAAGSTTFTDDYDDRLDPTIPGGCEKVDGTLECSTDVLAAGDSQLFTYTAVVPSTFAGLTGEGDCDSGEYLIENTATAVGGSVDSQDVCVTAVAHFLVTKSVDLPDALPGETVHYTVTVTNDGAAPGSTTIVDDYDNRLTPSVPDGCTNADGELTCTTGELAPGASESFEYDAVLPSIFSGDSGIEPCDPGEYSVTNDVYLGEEVAASETVCVAARPRFTVAKRADDLTAEPGQEITYTVTVANTGSLAGATTFVDDYDDRLTPTVPEGCTDADGQLTCTTDILEPGDHQDFTYSADLPETYTGSSGVGGCATGSYPVANTAALDNEASATVTVCTAAAPNVSLSKSADLDVSDNGDQTITYTLTYTNGGSAEAVGTVVTDPVPAGTAFVSCSPACGPVDGVPTWNVGGVAPAGGTGTLVLAVRVTSNQTCVITNVAQIRADGVTAVASNTVSTNVTPQPDVANAKASGSATALSIQTAGLLDLIGPIVGGTFTNGNTLALSQSSSSQSGLGGPTVNSSSVLSARIPGNGSLVTAGVLTTTSASLVTAAPAEARNTTTSEVAGVCLVPVVGLCTVQSGTVRAVATTMATGSYAGVSTAGSAIEDLRVAGVAVPINLNQTTKIPLNKAIFGKNSYVAINERTSSAGLVGSNYVADQSVAMIHVKITGVLGLQAVEIYVAKAVAHSEFPKTFVCSGSRNQSVSGHAYTARLYTGPLLADLLLGYVQIAPLGGAESEHIAQVVIPKYGVIANAQVADSNTSGGFTSTASHARSWAEVAGDGDEPICVLSYVTNCVVEASLIRSEAVSDANAAGSISTDSGTTLVDLEVFGIPIEGTPAPNTTLVIPGIGFVILNEQFCDNGAAANHSCTAAGHTGLTVRAVRVVITVANNVLGLSPGVELIVSEAHADTTFG